MITREQFKAFYGGARRVAKADVKRTGTSVTWGPLEFRSNCGHRIHNGLFRSDGKDVFRLGYTRAEHAVELADAAAARRSDQLEFARHRIEDARRFRRDVHKKKAWAL